MKKIVYFLLFIVCFVHENYGMRVARDLFGNTTQQSDIHQETVASESLPKKVSSLKMLSTKTVAQSMYANKLALNSNIFELVPSEIYSLIIKDFIEETGIIKKIQELLQKFPLKINLNSLYTNVVSSPQGTYVIFSLKANKESQIWDVTTSKKIVSLFDTDIKGKYFFSQNEKFLYFQKQENPDTLYALNINTQETKEITGKFKGINSDSSIGFMYDVSTEQPHIHFLNLNDPDSNKVTIPVSKEPEIIRISDNKKYIGVIAADILSIWRNNNCIIKDKISNSLNNEIFYLGNDYYVLPNYVSQDSDNTEEMDPIGFKVLPYHQDKKPLPIQAYLPLQISDKHNAKRRKKNENKDEASKIERNIIALPNKYFIQSGDTTTYFNSLGTQIETFLTDEIEINKECNFMVKKENNQLVIYDLTTDEEINRFDINNANKNILLEKNNHHKKFTPISRKSMLLNSVYYNEIVYDLESGFFTRGPNEKYGFRDQQSRYSQNQRHIVRKEQGNAIALYQTGYALKPMLNNLNLDELNTLVKRVDSLKSNQSTPMEEMEKSKLDSIIQKVPLLNVIFHKQ